MAKFSVSAPFTAFSKFGDRTTFFWRFVTFGFGFAFGFLFKAFSKF